LDENNPGQAQKLGTVISGSLNRGIDAKLESSLSAEDIPVGRYVVIAGIKKRFFGMVTDIELDSLDPAGLTATPDLADPVISQILKGTITFVKLHIMTTLTIGSDALEIIEGPQPAKMIPSHFSPVMAATQADVERVFGKEDEKRFWIGSPLDMDTKVCLNTFELVKRSNGIFGKSGTGKTFLTRILLGGMIEKNAAVNLIFDMHSEYGWQAESELGSKVKGLRQLYPSKVAVFTLDEVSSKRRKVSTDYTVKIGYDEIEPEDIALLKETLGLTENSVQAVFQLARRFGDKKWLETFFNLSDDARETVLRELQIHEGTMGNLWRCLQILKRFSFLVPSAPDNAVRHILQTLESGTHVVLEFGGFDDYVAYILVANLLTRRIYEQYRIKTEKAIAEDLAKPKQLVIVIEEAHRFLNPELANQTIFGKIAREMRKYNVTLLVIDQRPSAIDEEVMSQLGTKITCLLDNEKDVDSVLSGVSGKSELKYVLSRLESKQQALIFGHAVPTPVVIKVRDFGTAESYKDFGYNNADKSEKKPGNSIDIEDLWK
jgi:DNA helicase HerA-like ATPase